MKKRTGIDTLSADEKRDRIEQADTLFEPITKLSDRALELFYDIQPSLPYQMRRQRVALASLGTLATLLDLQERATMELAKHDSLFEESPQGLKQHPGLNVIATCSSRIAAIQGKLLINVAKDSRKAMSAANIEEQARGLKKALENDPSSLLAH